MPVGTPVSSYATRRTPASTCFNTAASSACMQGSSPTHTRASGVVSDVLRPGPVLSKGLTAPGVQGVGCMSAARYSRALRLSTTNTPVLVTRGRNRRAERSVADLSCRLRSRPQVFAFPISTGVLLTWRSGGGGVAVGMPVARHPPHRSVRAHFAHTALTSDEWPQSAAQDKDAERAGGASSGPASG